MAAPYVFEGSNLTASLANNTSGTTFAAKARAAELNAVRSRKAAKEVGMEDEVPSITPVALGALKFTRTRNRGRGWKTHNLDELPEESVESDEAYGEDNYGLVSHTPHFIPNVNHHNQDTGKGLVHHNTVDSRILYGPISASTPSYQESLVSPQAQNLQDATESANVSNKNPKILQNQSRSVSTFSLNLHSSQRSESDIRNNPSQGMLADESKKLHESRAHQQPLLLSSLEEDRLRTLGVLPALKPTHLTEYPKQKTDDDPFIEQTPDPQRNQFTPYAQTPVVNASGPGHHLPPAVTETAKPELPLLLTNTSNPQPSLIGFKHDQQNVDSSGAGGTPYQRDPMPYSSFSMSNKKDMLLQNLQDVVESHKAQGNLPNSSRTVLYDPLVRDSRKQAQHLSSTPEIAPIDNATQYYDSSVNPPMIPINSDKELLNGSDALPWTDRPVHIQNSMSPLALQMGLHTVPSPTTKIPPPGLGYDGSDIWSLQPQPQAADHSLEETESWFMNSSVGEEEWQAMLSRSDSRMGDALKPIGDRAALFAQPDIDSNKIKSDIRSGTVIGSTFEKEATQTLFYPVFENLVSYLESSNSDYFGRFAPVPEWCIDKSHDGNRSFFGDWGIPPSRVGRDPRYRPTFLDGRYSVYDEIDRRGSREGSGRRF